MTPTPRWTLTAKIVLLVAVMGTASALLTAYASWHMQRIERHYHQLLEQQSAATQHIGTLRQHMSDISILAHTVLTARSEEEMLQAQLRMEEQQTRLEASLEVLYPLLPAHSLELDQVLTQSRHTYAAAERAVAATLRWRGDRALQVLSEIYRPAAEKLYADVDQLSRSTKQVYEHKAQSMSVATQQTMLTTTLASWLAVLCIAAVSARFALRHISQPIARLTQRMRRMAQGDYTSPVDTLEGHDEVGSMSRALRSFAQVLQDNAEMQRALGEHRHTQLLTEQLLTLTSALPGAVFQIRYQPHGPLLLQFVSPQWASLFGYTGPPCRDMQTIGETIAQWAPQPSELARQHFEHSASTLEAVDFELSIPMMDGVTRWIKTRANPFPQAHGDVLFHGVWTDVTKDRMQAQALEKAKRLAEHNAHEKSIFQASISHEIRTPLNAILGLSQLLIKGDLPPTEREQVRQVLRASQHLRGIVNEVLDFSKIDAGQVQLESTDFHLSDVVHDVLAMCREEALAKGLQLDSHIDEAVPLLLRGDPHRIAQILLNYVSNAIKFTRHGAVHISIRLEPSSTLHRIHLNVSVQDTGPGIPADRLPLVFQAFQQADNSITRRFGGTGLGLTISRALAQLMGGDTGVQSQLGQGSRFWFTAMLEPARGQVRPTSLHGDAAEPAARWQGQRVLVVDDHPLNRTVAQGLLEASGLEVHLAENGAQALQRLQAQGPLFFAAVLMDVQMPEMDGMSATRALRKLPGFQQLPVIAMTAHNGLQDIARFHAAGMNAHLAKPLLESALQAMLRQMLAAPEIASPSTATVHGCERLSAPPAATAEPDFDHRAIDDLADVFDAAQIQALIAQFCDDTLQRVQALQTQAEADDITALRGEAHKLSGTAATFGLLALGQQSQALSQQLKNPEPAAYRSQVQRVHASAVAGLEQLRRYVAAHGA